MPPTALTFNRWAVIEASRGRGCALKKVILVVDENSRTNVPGRTSRRSLLKQASYALSGLITLAIGWPLAGALVGPIFRKAQLSYAKVKALTGIPDNVPVKLSFPLHTQDAYMRHVAFHSVWVVKHSQSAVTVFSPICPHLGCRYDWFPSAHHFVCPCHGSVFSLTGEVLAGPAPRPLDKLPHRTEQGVLYVEWERFQPGVPNKVRI